MVYLNSAYVVRLLHTKFVFNGFAGILEWPRVTSCATLVHIESRTRLHVQKVLPAFPAANGS